MADDEKNQKLSRRHSFLLRSILFAAGLLAPATGVAGADLGSGQATQVVVINGVQIQMDVSKLFETISGIIAELLVIQSYITQQRADSDSRDPTIEAIITNRLKEARERSEQDVSDDELLRIAIMRQMIEYQAHVSKLSEEERAQIESLVASGLTAFRENDTNVVVRLLPEQREEVVAEVQRLLSGAAESANKADSSNS